MPPGTLPVKLGSPLRMTEKRLRKLLEQGRRDCCKARNAVELHWYGWRQAHPDWKPGGAYEAPAAKIKRPAKPRLEGKKPKDSPLGPRQFLSRELYGAARAAAPNLAGTIASSCVRQIIKRLKANTPYNHEGNARWVWQAILAHEVSRSTSTGSHIPCPRSAMRLEYDDDHCTLRFPLLSRGSGYTITSPTVRLLVGDLTRGNRRLLRRLASGEEQLADSQIVRKGGKWFVHVCYDVPLKAAGNVDPDRVLTLLPALPDDNWPFLLRWMDTEDEPRTWWIGKARPLVNEYRRIVARRRAIRYRYGDGCGKGHGRQRFYKSLRPMNRVERFLKERFLKQLVADIVKFAIRERCGFVLYREPTMPVRDRCWFAAQDVPFNWMDFEKGLKFKAEHAGLGYNNRPRIGMKEWQPNGNSDAS